MLRDDPARFSRAYRVLLQAARAEGIGPGRLPDFLGLEYGGELTLLGQEELDISVLEAALRDQLSRDGGDTVRSVLETERIMLAAARVGQHVFAFTLHDDDTIASIQQAHREACESSRRATSSLGLDEQVHGNRRGPLPLRWVYLHVLRELAQHRGHADILREQILNR